MWVCMGSREGVSRGERERERYGERMESGYAWMSVRGRGSELQGKCTWVREMVSEREREREKL